MRISDYLIAPLRATARLALLTGWILTCYLASVTARLGARLRVRGARALERRVSRTWAARFPWFLGTRVVVRGERPRSPCFLVVNHISWLDFFAMSSVCQGRYVVMAEAADLPLIGRLMTGLDPIYVRRTKDDKESVIDRMAQALRHGESLFLAPEAGTSPGDKVYRFHAALLEAAAVTRTPVFWASMTFSTPEGWPPASERIPFPDPYYPEAAARFGVKATAGTLAFVGHLLKLLALPYHIAEITFGADPIAAKDKIELATRLEEAVRSAFVPLR